jgi:hypothetical protein
MEFNKLREPIQKVGPGKYVIGDNPLQPQLTLDNDKVHVPTTLTISGVNFLDYFTGNPDIVNLIQNTYTDLRYTLEEAFELDENGDVVPSNAVHISDPMWILRNDNDLELRSNHWRYNSGPESFTDEISF